MAKIELRIHFNSQSESSLKRIIPEPSFPSRGSQARGTRLTVAHKCNTVSNRLREIQIAYAKFQSLTRNSNRLREIQIAYAKFKSLTRNSNRLREIPITYAKFKISRENSNAHARTFHILRQGHLGQRLRST